MARLLVDGETELGGDSQFVLDNWIETAPFEDLVGLEIEHADNGSSRLSCVVRVKLAQGGGVMHGGALTTLADTCVAMAIKSLLPESTVFATTRLEMTFLQPVRRGRVTAEAVVSGPRGRTLAGKAVLRNEHGEKVAEFVSEFRIARGQGYADPDEP